MCDPIPRGCFLSRANAYHEPLSHTTAGICAKEDARSYFDAVDQDGTGVIKYSEFIAAAMTESECNSAATIEAAFRRLDLDDSGKINMENLVAVLGPG